MNVDQTIGTFIDYYRGRGHRRLSGTSVIAPPGDPVLFTTSGMHPLTAYLQGRSHPSGRRLVNVQRCLRTTDLDEVGDDTMLTTLWRGDPTRTLSDLPVQPLEFTLRHFGQDRPVDRVRELLLVEQDRFRELVRRGRPLVLRRRRRGPLCDEDYRYLHDTHGLPRELVVGLLSEIA